MMIKEKEIFLNDSVYIKFTVQEQEHKSSRIFEMIEYIEVLLSLDLE